jgi:hypothetical protein
LPRLSAHCENGSGRLHFLQFTIAVRPYVAPLIVKAQTMPEPHLYIESGTALLRAPDGSRQALGKVVMDWRTGMWGFPRMPQGSYPAAGANTVPANAHPFVLGKFALRESG